jgi:hypothetical protein
MRKTLGSGATERTRRGGERARGAVQSAVSGDEVDGMGWASCGVHALTPFYLRWSELMRLGASCTHAHMYTCRQVKQGQNSGLRRQLHLFDFIYP